MVAPNIQRHARRIMAVKLAVSKAQIVPGDSGGPGFIEGYAAVWNNVDYANEIMRKGCFARTINQSVAARKVPLMSKHAAHGGGTIECIGTVIEAREDDYGLWIRAEFADTSIAQTVRTLVNDKNVDGLSVAFAPLRWEIGGQQVGATAQSPTPESDHEEVVTHLECILGEITVTPFPCNDLARILNSKSLQGPDAHAKSAAPVTDPAAPSSTQQPAATLAPSFDMPAARRDLASKRRHLQVLRDTAR